MSAEQDGAMIVREAEQDYAVAVADATDRIKNQMAIADATMKALLIANGGAMVALFTFVGNLVAKTTKAVPLDPTRIWIGFACFVAGLVAALIVHALAFLSQDRFYNLSMMEARRYQVSALTKVSSKVTEAELAVFGQGHAYYGLGFFLAIVSIVLFAVGCGFSLSGVLVA